PLLAMLDHPKTMQEISFVQAFGRPDIYLTRSHAPLEDLEKVNLFLPDAVVELYKEGNLLGQLTYKDTLVTTWGLNTDSLVKPLGKYTSEEIEIEEGTTYELKVSHPDYDNVSASTHVPEKVEIIAAELQQNVARTSDIGGFSASQSLLSLRFQDPAGVGEHYRVKLRIEYEAAWQGGEFFEEQIWGALAVTERQDEQGAYVGESAWYSDDDKDGQIVEVDFIAYLPNAYAEEAQVEDLNIRSFTVELFVANDASYEYILDYERQLDNSSGWFSLFPAESIVVFSNVEGGYGIFGGLTEQISKFE
ncbi:MAG: DUF4249 family protein, partial [Bacteroidota bacterium]